MKEDGATDVPSETTRGKTHRLKYKKFHSNGSKITFLLCRWLNTGTDWPDRPQNIDPWKYSKHDTTQPWAACSSWPYSDDLQRCLPTSAILWLHSGLFPVINTLNLMDSICQKGKDWLARTGLWLIHTVQAWYNQGSLKCQCLQTRNLHESIQTLTKGFCPERLAIH